LDRIPAWATTGVGSLPHDDPLSAVAHVAAAYDLPFCPQLPRLEGDMIAEWLGGDPGRCGWSPQRDRERPCAWDALLAQLQSEPPPHRLVKLQVTGPATLACALERERGGAPSRREAIALARELAAWLAANVTEQVQALHTHGLDALLVIDEPALELFGSGGVEGVWDPLRAIAPAWGLHLCCQVPWDLIERAEPDLLSFDVALAGVTDDAAAALRRLLTRGGRIAWGVLAVHRPEYGPHAFSRLRPALARVGAGGEQSLLTASCGTGRMSVHREAEIAAALRETARSMRARPAQPAAARR
jgi:hypothetical protein